MDMSSNMGEIHSVNVKIFLQMPFYVFFILKLKQNIC